MQLEDYFNFLAEDDIRLKGTRVGIETVLFDFLYRESSPETIAKTYPTTTLEQVYATILYYLHNKEAVTQYLADWIEWGRKMRKQQHANPSPATLRLRTLKAEKLAQEREYLSRMLYLLDENLDPLYKTQILTKESDFIVYEVDDPGCPAKGALDSEMLCWCEENSFVLITNDRVSMDSHLRAHLAQGHHVPGIVTLNAAMDMGETVEELILIAKAGRVSDYQDRLEYLQVT